jgi:hypothetical protein
MKKPSSNPVDVSDYDAVKKQLLERLDSPTLT